MESLISDYLGEILTGIVLGLFALAFRSWSSALSNSTERILGKLESLVKEFHHHRVETERRVTRMETKVDDIEKLITRFHEPNQKTDGG